METMEQTFISLPVEIMRMIVEFSARSSLSAAATLTCTCRVIHEWTIPIFYHTILVNNPRQATTLSSTLQRRNLASHVRNLVIACPVSRYFPADYYIAILQKCTQIECLVLANLPRTPDCGAESIISWPALRQVALTRVHVTWIHHPILQNVTHLTLKGSYLDGSFVNSCRYLTRLTHIRFWFLPEDSRTFWLEKLLAMNPELRMVLVTVLSSQSSHTTPFTLTGDPWIMLAEIEDPRLFVGLAPWDIESELMSVEFTSESVWINAKESLRNWREWVKNEPSDPDSDDFAIEGQDGDDGSELDI